MPFDNAPDGYAARREEVREILSRQTDDHQKSFATCLYAELTARGKVRQHNNCDSIAELMSYLGVGKGTAGILVGVSSTRCKLEALKYA